MMKYRIFERTVGDKVEYAAQVKRFGFWFYLLVYTDMLIIYPQWYSFYGSKQSFIDEVENVLKARYNRTPSKLVYEGKI